MGWGQFFTIIAQTLIAVAISLTVLFVGSAIVSVIIDKMKGK